MRSYMVSENLKAFKEAYKLNNRKLAKLLKISPVLIGNILNTGYSNSLRVDTVKRIADYLDVTIDTLLYQKIEFNYIGVK
ncbi:helix-turn-helix domain-containing protein [Terrisporobacter muris]|uniref:Helix-turn-helix domain-containing protein n=1 Tax=Terrisporobacter muris TaxID=2963284 RepID=A0A9X2M8G8_9FIRM|nr:helix-turn-helix transcriptional regulator [Terrisporobacter muris]MCR1821885.1 helix-turn-helix domain-containing protein [Terrisporobacter muris]